MNVAVPEPNSVASALAKLSARVAEDAALDAEIREAFVADLAAEKPADLVNLRRAISREKGDEASNPDSKQPPRHST